MLMSPSIQQMRSYAWLSRHLPKSVVLQVNMNCSDRSSVKCPNLFKAHGSTPGLSQVCFRALWDLLAFRFC